MIYVQIMMINDDSAWTSRAGSAASGTDASLLCQSRHVLICLRCAVAHASNL